MARPRASLAAVAKTVSIGLIVAAIVVDALAKRTAVRPGTKAELEANRQAIPNA